MLPLDDPRWERLEGGYRQPYDPRKALETLRDGDESAYDELWEELFHQGDVGPASYAAVPWLVKIAREAKSRDWQPFALVATIELARSEKGNPPLPRWLKADYERALSLLADQGLADLAKADAQKARSILGLLAIWKGLRVAGKLVGEFDESELSQIAASVLGNDER